MKQKIYIVEDHEVVRESYIMFLNMEDGLEVCGSAQTAEEALEKLGEAAPDLLLVDVSLPGMSGLELLERLRASDALMPALVLTGHDSDVYHDRALRAGARGFVMKHDGPDVLIETIHNVLNTPKANAE